MSVDRETWYRVPRSAEECAVHLEAGGVVEFRFSDSLPNAWGTSQRDFRQLGLAPGADYRLVYSTPVGMSPVIGAPGHAYGLVKDAPSDWRRRSAGDAGGWDRQVRRGYSFIEARPPAPAPEPRTEKVPLTKLVGRTLVGETEAVRLWWPESDRCWWSGPTCDAGYIPVDVETGLVEVLAGEEA